MTDMPDSPESERAVVDRWVARSSPGALLVIGDTHRSALEECLPQGRVTAIDELDTDWRGGEFPQRFDAAVVSVDSQAFSAVDPELLLSRLRDLYAGEILVIVPAEDDERWHALLTSLGFSGYRPVNRAELPAFYEFSLRTYKTTPDWLNPRFWANPERWDEYRW